MAWLRAAEKLLFVYDEHCDPPLIIYVEAGIGRSRSSSTQLVLN